MPFISKILFFQVKVQKTPFRYVFPLVCKIDLFIEGLVV